MKKLFVLGVFLLGSFCISNAQVTYGVKAGGNMAKFTNNDELDFKFGIHFGGMASIEVANNFSIHSELVYSAQGYRQNFNGQRVKAKVDYFNIPILGSYQVLEGLEFQFGPQVGINIRNDLEVEGQEQASIFVNDVDISAIVGIQYFIDDYVFMQFRGAVGLTEVLTNLDQKNFVLSLSLGVLFDRPESSDED